MKILIFAAHPDDAEVCVGGSICRYVEQGHTVHVINMTNNDGPRVACAQRAAEMLGFTVEFLDFEDIGSDRLKNRSHHLGVTFDPAHLQVVDARLHEHRPDLVWAHWPVDTHPDHVAAGSLVMRACDNIRLFGDWQPDLWFFAPALGYQAVCFQPNHYEDVTPYTEQKKQAVGLYDIVDIWQSYPLEETAMKYHGYASGYAYAEAFTKCHFRVGPARYEVIGDNVADDIKLT